MSLTLAAIILGAGALFGGGTWAWRRRRSEPKEARPKAPAPKPSPLAARGFSIELGDVVEIGGRELWLERGWVLSEGDDAVVALLSASEATLIALPAPSVSLVRAPEMFTGVPSSL